MSLTQAFFLKNLLKIYFIWWGIPGGSVVKNLPANAGDVGFNPWVRKIPWRRKWQPIPVFLPGKQQHPNFLCIFYHFSSNLSVCLYLKPSPYKQDIVVLLLLLALTITHVKWSTVILGLSTTLFASYSCFILILPVLWSFLLDWFSVFIVPFWLTLLTIIHFAVLAFFFFMCCGCNIYLWLIKFWYQ